MTHPTAASLARIALGHVSREWPHALSHVLDGPADVRSPRALHPAFFGSFDWHSCVHTFWLLAAALRADPGLPHAAAIRQLFDERLAPGPIAAECAYFERPAARGFERPYGWAWVLALHHALRGTPWQGSTRPLAALIARRFRDYLPLARYPVRAGTHFNSAFALRLAAPYAEASDPALLAMITEKAHAWYAEDAGCQAWEPSQDDFLSPALVEAACMHRLAPGPFPAWFARFLPGVAEAAPATLFTPAETTDRTDGKIAHLDGLNLSRAWCWREIAPALPLEPRRRALAAAETHLAAAIAALETDFMGEHWLASFAALALWPGALDNGALEGGPTPA